MFLFPPTPANDILEAAFVTNRHYWPHPFYKKQQLAGDLFVINYLSVANTNCQSCS